MTMRMSGRIRPAGYAVPSTVRDEDTVRVKLRGMLEGTKQTSDLLRLMFVSVKTWVDLH